MTWNAFLTAMRTGIQARVGGAAQRGARRAPQQMSASTSTQANRISNPNMGLEQDVWENLVLDEYGEPTVLMTSRRLENVVAVIRNTETQKGRSWENMVLDEYGEPTVLMLIPPF